jgi:hypothetical protein
MAYAVDIGPCYHCKEPMWMTQGTYETYLRNGQTFSCPHGHKQMFAKGKTDAQKLQEQLDEERRQRVAQWADDARIAREEAEHQRRRANGYKGHATRITKRAKAGVCPCCNRTFTQLARHMATQHPQFTPEVPEPPQLKIVA